MTLHKGCNLLRPFLATPYLQLGWGMGRPPMNAGSGASASFLLYNHFYHHPFINLGMGMLK
jgi:hypothetical protein